MVTNQQTNNAEQEPDVESGVENRGGVEKATAEEDHGESSISTRRWDELTEALATADVILSTTGAPDPVILPAMVETAVKHRKGKPLFILVNQMQGGQRFF